MIIIMRSKIKLQLDSNKMKIKQTITLMSLHQHREASSARRLVSKIFNSNSSSSSSSSNSCCSSSNSSRFCFSLKNRVFNLISTSNHPVTNSFTDHRRKSKRGANQSTKKEEVLKIKMHKIESISLSSKRTKSNKMLSQD